jgi:hypothetical protein
MHKPIVHAATLALWDVPARGMHNHSLVLRYKKNTYVCVILCLSEASLTVTRARLILADRRHCAYLPESERVRPHAGLRVVASAVGDDCHTACGLQVCRLSLDELCGGGQLVRSSPHLMCVGMCRGARV